MIRIIVLEAGRKVPPFPSVFFKPSTTVIGHGQNVIIPKIAQDDQADYEGELVSPFTQSSSMCHNAKLHMTGIHNADMNLVFNDCSVL
jgi:2-keto-4-pentenoate hydratase/2-oxohepta-3-ene-1,7-dioic acid hydratase in catechol pathway